MHRCLNKEELRQLILCKIEGDPVVDSKLVGLIEAADNWQVELGCLTYFLAEILERKLHQGEECVGMIARLYELGNDTFVRLHECNSDFVSYVFRSVRDVDLSMEEELVRLHEGMCEHKYD